MGSRYITPASLPDGVTYTNNGAVYGCHSDNQCQSAAAGRRVCPQNAECVDLWNEFECVCLDGKTVFINHYFIHNMFIHVINNTIHFFEVLF